MPLELLTILVLLGGTAGYKVTILPHSRSASHPLLFMPAQLAPRGCPIRLSADKFSNLKRADGPSEEETRSLQIIIGVFGWLIGPRFAGSAVMGAVVPILVDAAGGGADTDVAAAGGAEGDEERGEDPVGPWGVAGNGLVGDDSGELDNGKVIATDVATELD